MDFCRRLAARSIVPALGAVLAACGGTEPVAPPPPPPPPAAVAISVMPTTATVEAGETQQFTATVVNATNTAVTWSSSGGTLAGTAGAMVWTAPATPGNYAVTATSVADGSKSASASITVTLPNPVRVVLDDVAIAPGGGVLAVEDPASAAYGLRIAVPSGAFATATRWTVATVANLTPTLPAGAEQVGSALRFSNGQTGYAALPFTITLPARVAADRAVGAFYYDAATETWDPLPLLGRTDSTIVVMTRHTARAQLVPAGAAALRAGSSNEAPESADVVMVSVPLETLGGSVSTGYRPRVDDWPFENRGSWLMPHGYSTGASVSALYHFLRRKHIEGPLFTRDDRIVDFNHDNARAIRLASVIHADIHNTSVVNDRVSFLMDSAASAGQSWAVNQARALALALWLKPLPRLVAVYPSGRSRGAQSIVAFDMNAWKFGVSSTKEPGLGRQLSFDGTAWTPFDFSSSADEPLEPYTQVFLLGASALVPLADMERYWAAYENGTIGNGQFPALIKEYRDPVDTVWRALEDRVVTASESLYVRTRCASCGFKRSGPFHPDRILTPAFTTTGTLVNDDRDDGVEGTLFRMPTIARYSGGLLHTWRPLNVDLAKTIDWTWLDTERVEFTLAVEPSVPQVAQPVTFRVENGGIGDASMRYRWTVGTTETTTPFDRPYLEQIFNAAMNTVEVELIDADGHKVARASTRLGRRWAHVSQGSTVCGITDDRALYCWGPNLHGQAGIGTLSQIVPTPTRVVGGQQWVQVDTDHDHTCGLTVNGEVWCWGNSLNGGVGPAATADFQATPVRVPGLPPIQSITVGNWHTCGVADNGSAYCWGANSDGQLGSGTFSAREFSPQRVVGSHIWKSLSAGAWFTCGVTIEGGGYCWGSGNRWRPTAVGEDAAVPTARFGPQSLTTISVSDQAICGVTLQATGVCWGSSLDLPTGAIGRVDNPQVMLTGRTWVNATPGGCALDADGQAFCWGFGPYTGTGRPDREPSPAPVLGAHRFAQLSRFDAGACGVTTAGDLYCWGMAAGGRHANGSTGNAVQPVRIAVPE